MIVGILAAGLLTEKHHHIVAEILLQESGVCPLSLIAASLRVLFRQSKEGPLQMCTRGVSRVIGAGVEHQNCVLKAYPKTQMHRNMNL